MALQKLDKAEWHGFLDYLSKRLVGKRAEIEVTSLALGQQIEAEWLPLLGIAYDPKDDIVEIALESVDHDRVDHIINRPQELYVDLNVGDLASLEITDADDNRQIINLRDPLMLPSPSNSHPDARHGQERSR
jgi:translation initiation factor IF-1